MRSAIIRISGVISASLFAAGMASASPIDVTQSPVSMSASGADNNSKVGTLMSTLSTAAQSTGNRVVFPVTAGGQAYYYFSQGLHLSRSSLWQCDSPGARYGSAYFVIGAGYDGVVFDDSTTSPDGGFSGYSLMTGCQIVSMGEGGVNVTAGNLNVSALSQYGYGPINSTPFAAGDGIIIEQTGNNQAGVIVPPGAYLDSVNGAAGVLHTGFAPTQTQNGARSFRLPTALVNAASYTQGSNSVGVTGGYGWQPGDYIWSDAFPFGAWVWGVSGSAGAQTLTITVTGASADGAASYTGTGKLWHLPTGLRFRVAANANFNHIQGFPIGHGADCSAGSTPALNCTVSTMSVNFIEQSVYGFRESGDNTGASTYSSNIYTHNFRDVVEDGTVGSTFLGDSYNSGANESPGPVLGNCANDNASVFTGVYVEQSGAWNYSDRGTCGTGNGPVWFGGTGNAPSDVTILVSGGAQGPIFRMGSPSGLCFGYGMFGGTWGWSKDCSTHNSYSYDYVVADDIWNVIAGNCTACAVMTYFGFANDYYAGDGNGFVGWRRGFLIGGSSYGGTNASWQLSWWQQGANTPTSGTWKQGDVIWNKNPAAGGSIGWVCVVGGTPGTWKTFGAISN